MDQPGATAFACGDVAVLFYILFYSVNHGNLSSIHQVILWLANNLGRDKYASRWYWMKQSKKSFLVSGVPEPTG